jgi:hypothetical protein
VASAGAVTAGVTLTALVTPWLVGGCQTHQCDAFTDTEGTIASPGSGGVGSAAISADGTEIVWRSSPLYGPWIDFEGNHSLVFTFPTYLPDPYACQTWPAPSEPLLISIAQYNSDTGADAITGGSGQDAIVTQMRGSDANGSAGGFVLMNGSCQKYYVWIEAHFALPATPCNAGGGTGDAASD